MRYVKIFTAGAFALLAGGGAHCADLYVSPTGSDSNPVNSISKPYKTLAKAALVVNPGDTVWIMNGTYAPFTVRRSGTSETARVTWKAYPGHTPEIVSNGWNAIAVVASWQTFDGLTLTGNNDNVTLAAAEADYAQTTANPIYNGNGILLDNRSSTEKFHHLTVRNCVIRKFGGGGVAAIQSDYTVIEFNKIYENAWYARYGNSGATILPSNLGTDTGYRNIIRGNVFWNNRGFVMWKAVGKYSDGNGFILDTVATDYTGRTLVSDNLTVNNGGSGIHSYKGRNADIVNNTAYMNGDKVGYPDIYAGDSVNIRLMNNIVYSRVGGKNNSNTRNTNVQYDYNIYFNGTRDVMGAHDVVADPKLVAPGLDPRLANFLPGGASPAINTGVYLAGVTSVKDLAGTPRTQRAGIDRGAYEQLTPRIVSSLTASATVGSAFSYAISAVNYPVWYAASGLPAGLTLNTATGQISGTPQQTGTSAVLITAGSNVGSYTDSLQLTVGAATQPRSGGRLPQALSYAAAGWEWNAIGAAQLDSAPAMADGVTLAGRSQQLAGNSDGVLAALTTLNGDGTITARVANATAGAAQALAGVTIRASAAADAAHASSVLSQGRGAAFARRLQTGGGSLNTAASAQGGDKAVWLRIARQGDLFTSSSSSDGQNWRVIRRERIAMPAAVKAGLIYATGGDAASATYTDVSVVPSNGVQ